MTSGAATASGILVGGGLIVASTPAEARLVQRLALLRDRLPSLRRDARRGDAAQARLDEVLAARDAARISLDSVQAANQRLTSQRDVALDGRETAEAEVGRWTARRATGGTPPTSWR